MQIDDLAQRLRLASVTLSLRAIGRMCNVSHEMVRRLIGSKRPNVTMDCYNKIDEGLRKNGF